MVFDRPAKSALIVACVTLAVCGLGFRFAVGYLNIYLRKEPVQVREHFSTIARSLGEWKAVGSDLVIDAAIVEELGTDIYLDRMYALDGDPAKGWIMLHIAYYTGMIDAIPHVPDRCMVAGGFNPVTAQPFYVDLELDQSDWRDDPEAVHTRTGEPYPVVTYPHPITGRPVTVRMPIGDFAVRTTEFRHPKYGDSRIFAGFFFFANGQVTANPLAVRALAFDKTDRYAYYCKVQFTSIGDDDFTKDEFADRTSKLLRELLPEIMRCLPDWAEVESRSPASESMTAAKNE